MQKPPQPQNPNFLNLRGQTLSAENLENLLIQTRSITSQRNLEGANSPSILTNFSELDSLLTSVFAINHDLKNVVLSRQAQAKGIQGCFKKLRKDLYYVIQNFDIKPSKIQQMEKGFPGISQEQANPAMKGGPLMEQMDYIKQGIYSIERSKEFNFLQNMVNTLKSLENIVEDREAILTKYLEFGEVLDKANSEKVSRMEQLSKGLRHRVKEETQSNARRSSLREVGAFEIKENYSVLKEMDLNKVLANPRSSLGPGAISQYKKLMDSYAHMNNPKKETQRMEKKTSKKRFNSQKNVTNLRILTNLETKKHSPMAKKPDFSFQKKESNLLDSEHLPIDTSLGFDPNPQMLELQEELARVEEKLQEKRVKVEKYKKLSRDFKVRLGDLETMNGNLNVKIEKTQDELAGKKSEIEDLREVIEDLRNECYRLEQENEKNKADLRMATSCHPIMEKQAPEAKTVLNEVFQKSQGSEKTNKELVSIEEMHSKSGTSHLAEKILSLMSVNELPKQSQITRVESVNLASFEDSHATKLGVLRSLESVESEDPKGNPFYSNIQSRPNVFDKSESFAEEIGRSQIKETPKESESTANTPNTDNKINSQIWLKAFVKEQVKKISTRKQLEYKKDCNLTEQRMMSLCDLLKQNKQNITFQALRESLTPKEIAKILPEEQAQRCSIEPKAMSLEKLKRHLNQSGGGPGFVTINTSNFKNSEEFLEGAKEMLLQNYKTLEDLLIIPMKSLSNLDGLGGARVQEEEIKGKCKDEELNELKRRIEDLEEELEQTVTENEFYKMNWPSEGEMDKTKNGESDAENEKVENMIAEVEELKEQIFQIVERENELKEKVKDLEGENQSKEDQANKIESEMRELLEINQEMEQEILEHKNNVTEMQEMLLQVEMEKEEREKQRELIQVGEVSKYNYVDARRGEEMVNLQKNVSDLEEQNMKLFSDFEQVEEQNEVLKKESEEIKKDNSEKDSQLENLRTFKLVLEKGLDEAKLTLMLHQKEAEEQKDEMITLKQENQELQELYDDADQKLLNFQKHRTQKLEKVSNHLKSLVFDKWKTFSQKLEQIDKLLIQVQSTESKISKVSLLLQKSKDALTQTKIKSEELSQALRQIEIMNEQREDAQNQVVDSSEDMLNQMSRLSNSKLNVSRLSGKRLSVGDDLEEENNRLAGQVLDLEDQVKNLKEELNQLKFEKNDWEEELMETRKLRQRAFRQREEKEYLDTVRNSTHVSLKKENFELKRKLDKLMKMWKQKTSQSESQLWGAMSTIRASATPFQMSQVPKNTGVPQDSFLKTRGADDHPLANLNMTMVSNKDSNDSFLNRSGRSDIANNIKGIDKMIGEGGNEMEESVLVGRNAGHRRTSSDTRGGMLGASGIRNFAFKKEEKVSKFAQISKEPSQLDHNVSSSTCKAFIYWDICIDGG